LCRGVEPGRTRGCAQTDPAYCSLITPPLEKPMEPPCGQIDDMIDGGILPWNGWPAPKGVADAFQNDILGASLVSQRIERIRLRSLHGDIFGTVHNEERNSEVLHRLWRSYSPRWVSRSRNTSLSYLSAVFVPLIVTGRYPAPPTPASDAPCIERTCNTRPVANPLILDRDSRSGLQSHLPWNDR